ncbi:MAG: rhomboid family intramembrane serine protease [Bacteroidales bacterium]|nr:rhomboid family intramembrane serine protease [Bacteroidales bacterium]
MNSRPDHTFERKRVWLALLPSLVWVILVWLAFVVDKAQLFEGRFSQWGIMPREWGGLKGVLFSPFIHSSLSHVWSNTLPLFILTWFLFYFYSKIAFRAFFYLWIMSGLITWAIGRGAHHVGASGLVFALLFFLFFSGLVRRYIPLVAVSLVVAFIYGSTVWSIFPITEWVDAAISWEGHLSGALSGLIFAIVFRNEGPQKPVTVWEEDEDDDKYDDDDDDDDHATSDDSSRLQWPGRPI